MFSDWENTMISTPLIYLYIHCSENYFIWKIFVLSIHLETQSSTHGNLKPRDMHQGNCQEEEMDCCLKLKIEGVGTIPLSCKIKSTLGS